jgi:Pyridoxamine 5'-phosphate oxidase
MSGQRPGARQAGSSRPDFGRMGATSTAARTLFASFGAVSEPVAERPYMPGYGTLPAAEGSGLLPWSWAEERLAGSHDYWLATVTTQGPPHLMPVWAVWLDGMLWFSSANGSRKARNLGAEPRCTLSTDNPREPVVVSGRAQRVTEPAALTAMLAAENAKYGTAYGMDMVDPASNSVFSLRPAWVFALDSSDFTGSPTRFTFRPQPA